MGIDAMRRSGETAREACGRCGALEGTFHSYGCDLEACPFCGDQLISCACAFETLGIATLLDAVETAPYPWDRLTRPQTRKWHAILEGKGRIPFVLWPNLCARCGTRDVGMFMVPNDEWAAYVEPAQRDKVLCRPCYDEIKRLIDLDAADRRRDARMRRSRRAIVPSEGYYFRSDGGRLPALIREMRALARQLSEEMLPAFVCEIDWLKKTLEARLKK
jgi:ribosomal protein S27AE